MNTDLPMTNNLSTSTTLPPLSGSDFNAPDNTNVNLNNIPAPLNTEMYATPPIPTDAYPPAPKAIPLNTETYATPPIPTDAYPPAPDITMKQKLKGVTGDLLKYNVKDVIYFDKDNKNQFNIVDMSDFESEKDPSTGEDIIYLQDDEQKFAIPNEYLEPLAELNSRKSYYESKEGGLSEYKKQFAPLAESLNDYLDKTYNISPLVVGDKPSKLDKKYGF